MLKGLFQGYITGFLGFFKEVSRVIKKSFKYVSRKFLGYVESISRGIQENFQGVSGEFLGRSSWLFHGTSLKSVSRVFRRSFKEVL